jgi:hypothetical protein
MTAVTESDWVGMRALYLMLATDTSASQSPEVARINKYYRSKYGDGVFNAAIEAIYFDNRWRKTFNDPSVAFARRLSDSFNVKQKDEPFPETIQDVTKEQP